MMSDIFLKSRNEISRPYGTLFIGILFIATDISSLTGHSRAMGNKIWVTDNSLFIANCPLSRASAFGIGCNSIAGSIAAILIGLIVTSAYVNDY